MNIRGLSVILGFTTISFSALAWGPGYWGPPLLTPAPFAATPILLAPPAAPPYARPPITPEQSRAIYEGQARIAGKRMEQQPTQYARYAGTTKSGAPVMPPETISREQMTAEIEARREQMQRRYAEMLRQTAEQRDAAGEQYAEMRKAMENRFPMPTSKQ